MKTNSKKPLALAAVNLLILTLSAMPLKAEVVVFDKPVDAAEMGKMLFDQSAEAEKPSTGGVKMRSIKMHANTGPSIKEMGSVGLPIEFVYNSDEIMPQSLPFLEQVGKMITMNEYASKHLVIEGHTDAAGSDSYNQKLSQRRADAVKQFLTKNYAVEDMRLQAKGLGESKPLPGHDPKDIANRRVQFYSAN